MIIDNYNILIELVKEMQVEISKLDNQLEYNYSRIKEADIYLRGFREAEPEDFKVFSPRNAESVHKKEIERACGEKSSYEEKNRELLSKRNILASRIEKLNKVLNRENHNLTVLNFQEEDRRRIARELHDTSLQNLTHLVHKIELCGMYIDNDPIQAKLELSVINKRLRETINEIRETIFDLRPMTFDDFGIKTALERLIANVNEDNKFEIDADIDDVSCETNLVLVSIYRIVQESVYNIVKHSDAEKIVLQLKRVKDKCIIDIEDDGKGFEEESIDSKKHFGLSLMRERVELLNGNIAINSIIGSGTKIHAEIPLIS